MSLQLELEGIFSAVLEKGSSDLYFVAGQKPVMRIHGDLFVASEFDVLTSDHINELLGIMMTPEQRQDLATQRELDLGFSYKNNARFRINAYYQRGSLSAALRFIPSQIKTLEQLGLPPVIQGFADVPRGLILFTGPTGSGKSTTMASLVNHINHTRSLRILTVEKPVEYIFQHDRSTVEQREVGVDTPSFAAALDGVMRQSPDVVMVSEIFTAADFEAVLAVAETAHLVLVALPTSFAAPTLEWLINLFPRERTEEMQTRLANVLTGITTQRLVATLEGTQAPAVEVLTVDETVRGLIRKGQLFQLDDVILTRVTEGMIAFDRSLAQLVRDSRISKEEALLHVQNPSSFETLLVE